MKKKIVAASAAMLAVCAGIAQAASADQNGWYAGLDVSHARLGGGTSIDQAFAHQGITTTTSIQRSDTTWGAQLGYRFGPHFALEGGYRDLGSFGYTSNATLPGADTLQGRFKAHAWRLAPVGIVPLNDQWALFGTVGVTRVDADLGASSSTGATAPGSTSHANYGWMAGIGATYDINRRVYTKVELDRYARVGDGNSTGSGDVDQIGIGIGMRF